MLQSEFDQLTSRPYTEEVLDYAGLKLANEDETPDKEGNQ